MSETTDAQILENLQAAMAARDTSDGNLAALFEFFAESERYLRFLHPGIKNPQTPLADPEEGSREFGLMLYLLDNPTPKVRAWIDSDEIVKLVWDSLKDAQKLENLATTRLTQEDYNSLIGTPLVGPDGTIYGTATYEQLDLDPGWLLSALNYVINQLPLAINRFNTTPYTNKCAPAISKNLGPLIAIIGDWGTGYYKTGPAKLIMDEVRGLPKPPDYIMHLGDVYYAGTDRRPEKGEEQANFLDLWGDSPPETAFTLNSNHEMYGNASRDFGGSGIIDVALGATTPFAHQNKTTYFALDFGRWVILGLDSAYYSDAENGIHMYMEGAIGKDSSDLTERRMQQSDWIQTLDLADKKIIVMTHHNPIAYTGDAAKSDKLLKQVNSALPRPPDYWYWGHVHIGAAYNQQAACKPTWGRCVGHSAIPFGEPTGLEGKKTHSYYSRTHNLNLPGRCLNGYMTIRPNPDGSIDEAFYEMNNNKPVWSNR